jgi:hypothetical protein
VCVSGHTPFPSGLELNGSTLTHNRLYLVYLFLIRLVLDYIAYVRWHSLCLWSSVSKSPR